MSITPISGATPAHAPEAPARAAEELTTVTTHCDEKHWHDQRCPHSVTTRPAPRVGQPGYLLDQQA